MEYDIMKIRSLCDRYFDGETTAEEELALREYFASEKDIPEDLKAVKIMICGFSAAADMTYSPKAVRRRPMLGKIIWGTVAAAAIIAVCFVFKPKEISGYATDETVTADYARAMEGLTYLTYLEKFETTIDMAQMFAYEMENND
jgi:hypothetical protein